MSIRLVGLGIGVVLLTTIWGVCLLCCLLLSRRRGIENGIKYIFIAVIPTLILIFWPKNSCTTHPTVPSDVYLPIDHVAIPRIILTIVLVLFCLAFGGHFLQQTLFFESNTTSRQK